MATTLQAVTAEQLAAIADDNHRYELVRGELVVMSPTGNVHGRIAMRLSLLLAQHVRDHELGEVYAAETGFLLARNPDTVRAPDVAFVRADRLSDFADHTGYLPLAPDFVGEVVSPSDTFTHVEQNAFTWLDAGAIVVLVVDPGTRSVQVYRNKQSIQILREDGGADLADAVQGWSFSVRELFS